MLNVFFISYLKKEVNLDPTVRFLLQLSFSDTVTQEDVDKLLLGYEMNDAEFEFNYLLSLLKKKHPDIQFPKSVGPRLAGLIRYFHYTNTALLQGFNEVVEQLNQKNIPVMLIKGIAMKYFNPEESRFMYDVDFIVPYEYYEEAVKTAIDLGFSGDIKCYSADLKKGRAAVDIHRLFTHGEKNHSAAIMAKMFADAEKASAFGVDVLIPSQEDFLLMMMSNAYHNIAVQPPIYQEKSCLCYFDCARLIENNKNLNWDKIFASASEAGILYQVWAYLELLNRMLPSILPEGVLAKISMGEKTLYKKIQKDILFRENDKLYNKKQEKKLLECKTIGEVASALNVRLEWFLFAIVRKVSVVRFLYFNTIFRLKQRSYGI